MNREWLLAVAVLIILVFGIVAFFVLLPPELMTVANFIGYASSLSTIIMVLVYLFTTSRQLNIMRNQLNEMQFSRNVEVQPLPYLEKERVTLELPRYYTSPATEFKRMTILCRFFFDFTVTNIGNGPAIAVDFIPKLYGVVSAGKKEDTLVESIGKRVECISLREGDSRKIGLMFLDAGHKTVETLLKKYRVALACTITYKNALDMAFKEEMGFWISIPSEKEVKTIKSCLKTVKTAEIDFAEQVKEFEYLNEHGREKEANKIFKDVNKRLKDRFAGQEKLKLAIRIAAGSFSVSPISQSEYERLLTEKEEIIRRLLEKY